MFFYFDICTWSFFNYSKLSTNPIPTYSENILQIFAIAKDIHYFWCDMADVVYRVLCGGGVCADKNLQHRHSEKQQLTGSLYCCSLKILKVLLHSFLSLTKTSTSLGRKVAYFNVWHLWFKKMLTFNWDATSVYLCSVTAQGHWSINPTFWLLKIWGEIENEF